MDESEKREKAKYDALWASSTYREISPATLLTPLFLIVFNEHIEVGDLVTDFGCGSGKSAAYLKKARLKGQLFDFSDAYLGSEVFLEVMKQNTFTFVSGCLWNLPASLVPSDWFLCFDVMEHIPEEKVDAVFQQFATRCKKGGLLSIDLTEDRCGKLIGDVLHVNIKPASWWTEKIAQYFQIFQVLLNDGKKLLLSVGSLKNSRLSVIPLPI